MTETAAEITQGGAEYGCVARVFIPGRRYEYLIELIGPAGQPVEPDDSGEDYAIELYAEHKESGCWSSIGNDSLIIGNIWYAARSSRLIPKWRKFVETKCEDSTIGPITYAIGRAFVLSAVESLLDTAWVQHQLEPFLDEDYSGSEWNDGGENSPFRSVTV
jgi:hypothetical protein